MTRSDSPWFSGPYGFVVRDAKIIEPFKYRGQLGWFDVPEISGPDDPALFDATARVKAVCGQAEMGTSKLTEPFNRSKP